MRKIVNSLILIFSFLFLPFVVNAKENDIKLYLFYGDGCPHCAEEEKFLSTIEDKYDNLEIVRYEVWYDDSNALLLKDVERAFGITRSGVPTTVIGNTTFSGYADVVGKKIERAIEYYSDNDYVDQVVKIKEGTFDYNTGIGEDQFSEEEDITDSEMTINIPFVGAVNLKKASLLASAVVIGLVDGFNPCAMWILLFLISVLIGMKNKKRMWILGLTFLVTSALVYMLIMLSWIQIAVKITAIVWIRNIIAVIALIGAFINIRSYIRSNDSGCEVVDDKKRKTIFKKIRKFTHEKSLFLAFFGVVGLAVSVNLVELACSAGLPLVFTELLVLNNVSSVMKFVYMFVYILFFLLDDLIIFFIAMFTMKVTGISTKYNRYSHLLGGIIMVIIGVLLLFKPGWLMFQFK
ncbi:MAG: hypothetical protein IJI22_04430 [Bacilli bacterium]|nr:hypothetical protein [Bacilli bacterium]